MKKSSAVFLSLLLLLAGVDIGRLCSSHQPARADNNSNFTVDPCENSAIVKLAKVINISSATTTVIVPVVGGKQVFVCGFSMTMVGAAETIAFEYGTQTTNPCDTGTTLLTGAFADGTASDIAFSYGGAYSTIFSTIAAQQLCAVTTGTVSIQGVLTYVQQ